LAKAGVSKLAKVEFARNPYPALLKEPAQFWDEIYIANEAYMLDEVTHPRIRRVLAYDAASHRLFLEYVEGVTLQELVATGQTVQDPGRTHRLLQSVAETVADMHAGILCDRPIVHNDLKSMNVLVPAASPRETVLIDFSHSFFEGRLPPFITDHKHDPAGTAKYMAPEKWAGNFDQGIKSDVFAFGVMAYFASTGRHPFDGDQAQIEQQIRERKPPSPIELGANVIRNTVVTIMACLEKEPERRYQAVAQAFRSGGSGFFFGRGLCDEWTSHTRQFEFPCATEAQITAVGADGAIVTGDIQGRFGDQVRRGADDPVRHARRGRAGDRQPVDAEAGSHTVALDVDYPRFRAPIERSDPPRRAVAGQVSRSRRGGLGYAVGPSQGSDGTDPGENQAGDTPCRRGAPAGRNGAVGAVPPRGRRGGSTGDHPDAANV